VRGEAEGYYGTTVPYTRNKEFYRRISCKPTNLYKLGNYQS